MSAAPVTPIVREPMSLDEFFALDVVLAELVDGQPVILSSPNVFHQVVLTRLMRTLFVGCPPDLLVLPAPMDWVLWEMPAATVRQPDIMVVPAWLRHAVRVTTPPVLAVVVVSDSSVERDLVAKRREYAKAGAAHYWLVHPARRELVVLRLEGERYTEVGRVEGDGRLAVTEPFPVTLVGTALFGDLPDGPTA